MLTAHKHPSLGVPWSFWISHSPFLDFCFSFSQKIMWESKKTCMFATKVRGNRHVAPKTGAGRCGRPRTEKLHSGALMLAQGRRIHNPPKTARLSGVVNALALCTHERTRIPLARPPGRHPAPQKGGAGRLQGSGKWENERAQNQTNIHAQECNLLFLFYGGMVGVSGFLISRF